MQSSGVVETHLGLVDCAGPFRFETLQEDARPRLTGPLDALSSGRRSGRVGLV